MEKIYILETSRDCYDKRDAMPSSMTVAEMRDMLANFDDDAKIIFSNDNGYTYGIVCEDSFRFDEVETREEERLREEKEELEDEIFDLENEIANLKKVEEHWDEDDKKEFEVLTAELSSLQAKLVLYK